MDKIFFRKLLQIIGGCCCLLAACFGYVSGFMLIGIQKIIENFKYIGITGTIASYALIPLCITVIILGALSSIGGNPMGLSLQALGQTNAQYVANANLEVTKKEKELNILHILCTFINYSINNLLLCYLVAIAYILRISILLKPNRHLNIFFCKYSIIFRITVNNITTVI